MSASIPNGNYYYGTPYYQTALPQSLYSSHNGAYTYGDSVPCPLRLTTQT